MKFKSWFLCFLSAVLLILAFPRTDLWILAWFALIPLLFALDGKKPAAAFICAYACGWLFFAGTLYWFFNIVRWFSWLAALGIVLLFSYLALYFGLFGFAYSYISRRRLLIKLVLLPSAWVALEFTRAHLFTGFDWASLGHSQYKNLPVIQIADVTGVFGVSFLVMMVNVLLKDWLETVTARRDACARRQLAWPMLVTALAVAGSLSYGAWRLSQAQQPEAPLSVAVVQANIPQDVKWHATARSAIVEEHIALGHEAGAQRPDVMIWPETSFPGYLWEDRELFERVRTFAQYVRIPLLVGTVLEEGGDYFNAAMMLSAQGEVAQIYRKIHLVPFGEFIPMRRLLPWVSEALGIGDFSRGKTYTTFTVSNRGGWKGTGREGTFSVLICFEDTVARLSRHFVLEGAQLLVNMTNDAWFGNTKAPFLHLQSSVFRTVENRRGLVRAANTGVSGYIDPWGRISDTVRSDNDVPFRQTYIHGHTVAQAHLNDRLTFYTKFGDVFAILCFGCILGSIAGFKISNNGKD